MNYRQFEKRNVENSLNLNWVLVCLFGRYLFIFTTLTFKTVHWNVGKILHFNLKIQCTMRELLFTKADYFLFCSNKLDLFDRHWLKCNFLYIFSPEGKYNNNTKQDSLRDIFSVLSIVISWDFKSGAIKRERENRFWQLWRRQCKFFHSCANFRT